MKILSSIQTAEIADPVRSKFAMVVPVLEATLYSLSRQRIERLGGIDVLTLEDLAREYREGDGDTGICFEYAVHEAIARQDEFLWPLASEVLEDFCGIPGGSSSILFGPEKDGLIPILESVQDALTDDSRLHVGNRGQPPKLRRYIPQIVRAFNRKEARLQLPRSINGLWKADLFLGNSTSERWVGATVKSNASALVGAQGLRIGIYPKVNQRDAPRRDESLGLIRLPIPYDGDFMELFYKSFYLSRAFLKADARVPSPAALPDAEDRFITGELAARAHFPLLEVLDVIRDMAQADLLSSPATDNEDVVTTLDATASLSQEGGLTDAPVASEQSESVSITPTPFGAI
jgi:hypothetical protein